MATELLLELLEAGLVDIGEDDSRYKAFCSAASELALQLAKTPELGIAAVVVAIDADAAPDEAALGMAEDAVKAHWQMFRQRFKERPVALLRYILFSACDSWARADSKGAFIISNAAWSAAAVLPACRARPRMITALSAATRAGEAWAVDGRRPTQAARTAPAAKKAASVKVSRPTIDREAVYAAVERAAGPSPNRAQAQGYVNNPASPNPHWSNANSHWSWDFAPRMADAVATPVNAALSTLAADVEKSFEDHASRVDSRLDEVNDRVASTLSSALAKTELLAMQAEVLWWSESLYCAVLCVGYRELSPATAVLQAAFDLFDLTDAPAPASTAFVLGEVLRRLSPPTQSTDLTPFASAGAPAGGAMNCDWPEGLRRPLVLSLLASIRNPGGERAELARSALTPGTPLTAPQVGMWCFRELLALRVADKL